LEKVGLGNILKSTKDNDKKERTILMITSTSYTPDEDLGMLIDALELLSKE